MAGWNDMAIPEEMEKKKLLGRFQANKTGSLDLQLENLFAEVLSPMLSWGKSHPDSRS